MTNTNSLATSIPRTLIADDQPDVAAALRLLLKEAGYHTEAVSSPAAVLDAIKRQHFDVVLIDLNYARDTTSGQEGLDLIKSIRNIDNTLPVVVLTGWATVEIAVEAMHRGVRDFVQKPWDNRQLLRTLRTQIEFGRRRRRRTRLDKETRSASRRLRQELGDAEEIQRALLPRRLPAIEGFEIAVAWEPARAVSGDYFDVIKFNEQRTGICIADVAGKGMPAALLMSNVQAALKSLATETFVPGELFNRVNSVVCENILPNRFISCFYGLIDTTNKSLIYANAGHYAPIVVRDGSCIRLNDSGPVLGVFPKADYRQTEVQLQANDCLVLFTDGVTEARSPGGEEFGEDRLQQLLVSCSTLRADEVRARIMAAVTEFSEGNFDDDVTLMVLKVK
jgi:sigma-B regulation protein RsbU (phosphoserine phosphatase)